MVLLVNLSLAQLVYLQETERLIDLLEPAKLKKRVDRQFADKLAQKYRLKTMLLADQIPLKR